MLAKDDILQDRYRIVRRLGHGGMGAVYEAKDERLGSLVALKEIIIELDRIPVASQQEMFRRAFAREAKLLANLHHEAFPRVTDYFSEKESQFLIMELIKGDDLSELLIKNKQPFPIDDVLKWTNQLLDALDYLHTRTPPIFHRDIKPQNLKITSRGKIRLLDFGIAKSVDNSGSTTTNRTFVGATLNYAPIEQVLPALTATFREFIILKHEEKAMSVLNQNTDASCDIYSLGATIYHLLTGKEPTDSAKRCLDVWEGKTDPLENPVRHNPKISLELSDWLLKSLEIEREKRFSSASEMQKALQAVSKKNADQSLPNISVPTLAANVEKPSLNSLMQAETEEIFIAEELKTVTKPAELFETQTAPTKPDADLLSDNLKTETVTINFPQTQPTEIVTKSQLTEAPFFNPDLLKTNPPFLSAAETDIKKSAAKSKNHFLFLIVPILGFLGLGVLGSFVWLNSGNTTNVEKPVSNQSVATPSPTQTVETKVAPTLKPSPIATTTPKPDLSPQKKAAENKEKQFQPMRFPTPNVLPPPPAKTPIPKIPESKPAAQRKSRPKPAQDPNCVFTNSCQ